jgi:hypothetical protein
MERSAMTVSLKLDDSIFFNRVTLLLLSTVVCLLSSVVCLLPSHIGEDAGQWQMGSVFRVWIGDVIGSLGKMGKIALHKNLRNE